MVKKSLCLLTLSLLLLAGGFSTSPLVYASTLFIGTEKGGECRALINHDISENTNFSLRYIHSVDKLPVEEFFEVGLDDEIYLVGMRFIQLPYLLITLPHEENLTYIYSPPWTKVENLKRKIGSIKVRVSSFTKQRLIFEDLEVNLFNLIEQGQLIIIKVESGQSDEVIF